MTASAGAPGKCYSDSLVRDWNADRGIDRSVYDGGANGGAVAEKSENHLLRRAA